MNKNMAANAGGKRGEKKLARELTLLIVDDQDAVREGLKKMILEFDLPYIRLIDAHDGPEALRLYEDNPTDIIITDIMMPGMNGLEFITRLRALKSKAQIIILSFYDRFDFAKQAIGLKVAQYLIKPVAKAELFQVLTSAIEAIYAEDDTDNAQAKEYHSLLFRQFIIGGTLPADSAALLRHVGLDLDEYYAVAVASNDRDASAAQDARRGDGEIPQCRECGGFRYICYKNNGIHIYILNLPSCEQAALQETVSSLMRQDSGCVFAGVSDCLRGAESLPVLYQRALDLYKRAAFHETGLLFYNGAQSGGNIELSIYECNKLTQHIQDGDMKAVDDLISGILMRMRRCKADWQCVVATAFKLINYISIRYPNAGITSGKDVYARLDDCASMLSLKDYILEVCSGVCATVEKSHTADEQLGKIIEYIKENYQRELSLSAIAEHFGVNYFYLSSLFNKTLKMSFPDYLNNIRLENASEQICNTEKKISQIALDVGYTDSKYFCRIFKKNFFLSPKQFRHLGKAAGGAAKQADAAH